LNGKNRIEKSGLLALVFFFKKCAKRAINLFWKDTNLENKQLQKAEKMKIIAYYCRKEYSKTKLSFLLFFSLG